MGEKVEWDTSKFLATLEREAMRVHLRADFLTPVERDTFTRALEMMAWIIHDRDPDRQQARLDALKDEELQPFRDWMKSIGEARETWLENFDDPKLTLPSFTESTDAERIGRVVGIRPEFDPK